MQLIWGRDTRSDIQVCEYIGKKSLKCLPSIEFQLGLSLKMISELSLTVFTFVTEGQDTFCKRCVFATRQCPVLVTPRGAE